MSLKIVIAGFGVVMVGLAVGVFFVAGGQKPEPETVSYSAQAVAEVPLASFDLGDIKVSDVKQNDFVLRNSGTKPLQINKMSSSCGCTVGQIIYGDFESREYGMHSQSGYVTEIAPGETAVVRVIYRPYVMPVNGPVERDVYIETNDPQNRRLVFSVKANVN